MSGKGARAVYWLLRAVLGFVLRLYFRRIEIVGAAHVPAGGPIIFVLNHPNALVDPLFVMCLTERRVSFMAKAPIFRMPVIGFLARAVDALPVYRQQDAGSDPAQNRLTFERARDILKHGGTLALFPEGVSHSDTKLKPLKTGTARIALGAAAELGDATGGEALQIVPAALYYTAKDRFRSSALLAFGAPIPVEQVALDEAHEPPRPAVRALTEKIDASLHALALEADDARMLALAAAAERIFVGASAGSTGPTLHDELVRRRRLVDGYRRLRARDPGRLAKLEDRVAKLELAMRDAGVEPEALGPVESYEPARVTLRALTRLGVIGFALPLAIVGVLIHLPAYRLVGAAARRYSNEPDITSTVKMLAAFVVFPVTWALVALGVTLAFGPAAGVGSLLVLPILARLALSFRERIVGISVAIRAGVLFFARRQFFAFLVEERDALHREFGELERELFV